MSTVSSRPLFFRGRLRVLPQRAIEARPFVKTSLGQSDRSPCDACHRTHNVSTVIMRLYGPTYDSDTFRVVRAPHAHAAATSRAWHSYAPWRIRGRRQWHARSRQLACRARRSGRRSDVFAGPALRRAGLHVPPPAPLPPRAVRTHCTRGSGMLRCVPWHGATARMAVALTMLCGPTGRGAPAPGAAACARRRHDGADHHRQRGLDGPGLRAAARCPVRAHKQLTRACDAGSLAPFAQLLRDYRRQMDEAVALLTSPSAVA